MFPAMLWLIQYEKGDNDKLYALKEYEISIHALLSKVDVTSVFVFEKYVFERSIVATCIMK